MFFRRLSATVFLFLAVLSSYGQEGRSRIRGVVVEADSQEPVIQAVIELLNAKDSTRIDAAVSDLDGKFSIIASPGNYILKFTMLGLEEQTRSISISQSHQDNDIGTIRMEEESMVLESARTVAKVPPVTIVEDTVVYNAAAYRVDDDASITELLKKIPGLELEGNKVSLHGKTVNKLMINGKEAFGDDIVAGLKNMPAQMIEKIKAYERETDEAKISGVDDGEELTVIDLTVKKDFLDGWHSNASAGYGSSGRYSGRYSTNKLTDEAQIAAVANIGNENESGLSSNTNRNRLGSGNAGETTEGTAGITFSKKKGDIESNGNFRYTGSDRDAIGQQVSESILKTSTSFNSSTSDEITRSHDINANYNIQIKPSTKTTVLIKPSITYSTSNSNRDYDGRTFSDADMTVAVNASNNYSQNGNKKVKAIVSSQVSHRFNTKGRTLSGNLFLSHNGTATDQYQDYNTYYYKSLSTTSRETDNIIDARSSSATFTATYNEPLSKVWSLQSMLSFYYRHEDRERTSTDLKDSSRDEYTHSTYNYHGIKINEALRYAKKKVFSVAGITVLKQWGSLPNGDDVIRTESLNASPFLRFNYNKNKNNKLRFQYTGSPQGISLFNLSPDINKTNPLYIHCGNPYLKPAFIQNATLSYNASNIVKQSSLICSAQYSLTNNAVSNSTEYDAETGARTVTPQNINGNWKASGSAVWNKTLKDSRFSFSSHSWAEYQNNMAYLYDSKAKKDETNHSTRLLLREKVETCWRSGWMEVALKGTVEYTDERSLLRPAMDQRPYFYSLGLAPAATLPWRMRLSSSFDVLCQRGYDNVSLNKDYLLWNVTASQTFFKGRMTARLSAYDLLNQQCNMIRNFTAERRTTTTYNGVHRYAILRLLWRF